MVQVVAWLNKAQMSRYKGILMVLTGSILWGLSGTVAQFLFEHRGFEPGWLVTIRLIVSGLLLLGLAAIQNSREQIWKVWKEKRDRSQLIVFGILGMLCVQYTYFVAIEEGNAATATLLQYLGPLFITIYVALKLLKLPTVIEMFAVGLALIGVFFLVTNGSFEGLTISQAALWWGLASAVALAFYTLYPGRLLKRWDSTIVVGWGMLIGGIGLSPIYPPWEIQGPEWSLTTLLWLAFVIIFGTLIPFYLYLESLRYIKPTETSLLASAEPLAAALAAIIWLQVPFGLFQILGGVCIIATVALLSFNQSDRTKLTKVKNNKFKMLGFRKLDKM